MCSSYCVQVTTAKVETSREVKQGLRAKEFFEKHPRFRTGLLVVVLLGTCMFIADGVFTPAISVLSAVTGIKVAIPSLHEDIVIAVSCCILIGLFALQHFGTHQVAFLFAPIVIAWLFCIASVGLYNIIIYNPRGIWAALSPVYMYKFLKLAGRDGWTSLGGIVLCMTGTEAMFADLGHFNQMSIKIAFTTVVYPCLLLGYIGQAAYLYKNPGDVSESFYKSIPRPVFWPVFVVATLAAVVGSQAVITATFSIIKQCQSLGCFPRVKLIYTSKRIHGQIYIPEINWILFILCLAVTVGFRDTITIGNAYGLAVITVMLVTTCLMALVILVVWRRNIIEALGFLVIFGVIELFYISACIMKVPQGGWVPLVLTVVFMSIMYIWNYGTIKKYEYDLQNKVNMETLLKIGGNLGLVRVPGVGLVYTKLVTAVPPIFSHFFTNLPALHDVLVLVSIKSVQVPYIPSNERCLVGRIGPKRLRMYRCVVRYGYKDIHKDDHKFEDKLLQSLGEYILMEDDAEEEGNGFDDGADGKMHLPGIQSSSLVHAVNNDGASKERFGKGKESSGNSKVSSSENPSRTNGKKRVRFETPARKELNPAVRQEYEKLKEAREKGVVYILGHSHVQASSASSMIKKFSINIVYTFLRRICRGPGVVLHIPQENSIQIGVVYRV
ncbi:probable potassium transporter 2 isoform X3 [Physcomitrium patens]|uniref:Potassium transporter n=1 Tax=Physcomitrium patens TaxID=3218 RepID=A0A7I4D8F5_PHYPA|nr:probable potassium transporter 2 isoform X2 [Physcomitrium patens]|eukprot:XP_024370285.1 probable potassium transporter 2 isoform X2 [Physcomitrella patens]